MKKENIILGTLISITLIGIFIGCYMYEIALTEEEQYQYIKNNINSDIKQNMSQSEVHEIVKINCQNMKLNSDVYECILRYDLGDN